MKDERNGKKSSKDKLTEMSKCKKMIKYKIEKEEPKINQSERKNDL